MCPHTMRASIKKFKGLDTTSRVTEFYSRREENKIRLRRSFGATYYSTRMRVFQLNFKLILNWFELVWVCMDGKKLKNSELVWNYFVFWERGSSNN